MNPLFQSKSSNLFVLIRRYSTLFDLLWWIMLNYSFRFIPFRFVLRFQSPLFCFVLIHFRIQTLEIRLGHELNHKKHYSPELTVFLFRFSFQVFLHYLDSLSLPVSDTLQARDNSFRVVKTSWYLDAPFENSTCLYWYLCLGRIINAKLFDIS